MQRVWSTISSYPLLVPPFALFCEDLPAHLQHGLETLPALDRVLSEPLDGEIFNAVLYLLPATAQRGNSRVLFKDSTTRLPSGSIYDGLLHGNEIVPGHVLRAHGDFLRVQVDVGGFVDV